MRKHTRLSLPEKAVSDLRRRSKFLLKKLNRLKTNKSRAVAVEKSWEAFCKSNCRKVVEILLRAMSSQLPPASALCMFCERDRAAAIDHFVPKSLDAAKTFQWNNFIWSCQECNGQKSITAGSIINPTVDDPLDHLLFSCTTGAFLGVTDQGKNSVAVFPWLAHDESLNTARRDALIIFELLLGEYDKSKLSGDSQGTNRWKNLIIKMPFSDVFVSVLGIAKTAGGKTQLGALADIILRSPEISSWRDEEEKRTSELAIQKAEQVSKNIRISRQSVL